MQMSVCVCRLGIYDKTLQFNAVIRGVELHFCASALAKRDETLIIKDAPPPSRWWWCWYGQRASRKYILIVCELLRLHGGASSWAAATTTAAWYAMLWCTDEVHNKYNLMVIVYIYIIYVYMWPIFISHIKLIHTHTHTLVVPNSNNFKCVHKSIQNQFNGN